MKRNKATAVIAAIVAIVMYISGCGGGGGWSGSDTTQQQTSVGSVAGYAYQSAEAALRVAAGRAVLVPLAGATVSIAGKTGITDSAGYYLMTGVPVGAGYSLQISKAGFTTVTVQNVTVTSNATTTATGQNVSTYALTPSSTVSFSVSSTPAGAAIYINGEDTDGVTPNTFTLGPDSYSIKLTATGYENYEQSATVSSSGGSVSYTMVKKTTAITAVTPTLTVNVGSSATPSVTCTFYDGSTGACNTLSWTSANSSVAYTNATTGQTMGAAAGTTSITGTRTASNVSVTIPVTVLASGETLQQVIIDAEEVSNNSLTLSSEESTHFTGMCVYSLSGSSTCPTSCAYSSSNTGAGTINSGSGLFACAAAGGLTDVKLTCGGTDSNTVEVSCAMSSTTTQLKVYGAPDANGDGEADGAFSNSVSLAPGTDLIVRLKVENGTALTGFRADLEINGTYISPQTVADSVNCSAYGNLAYDTSSLCIVNFGTVLSPSNPFFGTSTLDTIAAATYVSGSTVESLQCVDASKKANRLDCAVSTRQSGDIQPEADGSGYFAYFLLKTSASAGSGTQTTISISVDTMKILTTDGVEVEIGASQVSDLTVTFQ